MPLPPSRRDSAAPPPRNISDLSSVVRHHGVNLRSLDPGFLGGTRATPQLVPPGDTLLVGGDEGGADVQESIVGEDGDRLILTSLTTKVWRLSAEPISETLHVRFHPGGGAGVPWVRGEHYTIDEDDSLITITAESLAAARAEVDDVFSAQYLREDTAEPPGPVITSPEDESSTTDATPTISGTSAGDRPIEVFVDGASVGTTTATSVGTWSLVSTTLSLGAHTAIATQTNPDGSTIASPEVVFTVNSPTPATASLRGTRSAIGSGGPVLNDLALPTGTQIGDLIAVSAKAIGSTTVVFSDPRLTQVGSALWIGFATDLTDIQVDAAGGFGNIWGISCITLITNAVGWTASQTSVDLDIDNGDTLALGSIGSVGAAVVGTYDVHDSIDGNTGLPTGGWTAGESCTNNKAHARVDFWNNGGVLGTTPSPSSTLYSGGNDGLARTTVVGLIGP